MEKKSQTYVPSKITRNGQPGEQLCADKTPDRRRSIFLPFFSIELFRMRPTIVEISEVQNQTLYDLTAIRRVVASRRSGV